MTSGIWVEGKGGVDANKTSAGTLDSCSRFRVSGFGLQVLGFRFRFSGLDGGG